ncbi:hypothetical protein [Clostridium sporogenes]|uniref:hypothetical protein n=1 Tax=Clostridium sporogenes TaxID=1509 RepID=UPI0007177DC8|nr:hypothetical protein [Clostridium sporogenes]KRU40051.1 hypothetical protein VT94_25280 [Clostridium sporogenes]MBY7065134.1 DNA topoisomerase [Clostridium sporogenes]MBY7071820.1 DNA topoisomerase [Clostridium sporogenes]MCW6065878.1 hypothetical protein [Clostridium sporogenes]OQP88551.1 hypothetical protein VT93_0201950 [Clostridium sporogenes]
MNIDGVLNDKDFKINTIGVKREDFKFPDEVGVYTIKGRTVARYWGKKGNLILLLETDEGRKLKFAFWNNKGYCIEPLPFREVDNEKDSVRYLPDGTNIALTYEKSYNAKITRVRNLIILD